ncbi:MAG: hypothetical protein FE78DRAFT_70587 [Acidomyces sp. 'richmondensis']|nr:MAG: hypothetical protein FE78DRAFT_70587 [Acidomyces sp. 'richmondensis']
MAVVDRGGGVQVYSLGGAINRPHPAAGDFGGLAGNSDIDAVVGMHWLRVFPTEFSAPYFSPARKSGDIWSVSTKSPDQKAPRINHPSPRGNALLYITCSGRFTLLYQNEPGIWFHVSAELESSASSEELLSHAAFGEHQDHLYAVTYGAAKRFRVYRVSISWNPSQITRNAHNFIIVNPVLNISHLTALEHAAPQHAGNARLTLLRIVSPPPPHAENGVHVSSVLAVFTHASPPMDPASNQACYSTLCRWTIESMIPTLHPGFSKLKQSGPTPVQNPVTVLKRQNDIFSAKVVVSVDVQYHNTLLALLASDGTIEYRDTATWSVIEPLADMTTASSLPQAGFEHNAVDHLTDLAPSPDGAYIVYAKPDGSLTATGMTLRYGWQLLDDNLGDTRPFIETAIVCLARQYAILSTHTTSNDEILALLPPDLPQEMRLLFVKQIMRMLCRALDVALLDHTRQQKAALMEASLSRAMSAQLALGTKPNTRDRTFQGQFAYAYLNLRYIGLALLQSLTQRDTSSRAGEIGPSLAGPVKWSLNFIIYIVDSLAEMKRAAAAVKAPTSSSVFEHWTAQTGNPVLFLLLCSTTRVILRMHIYYIVNAYIRNFIQAPPPPTRSLPDRHAVDEVQRLAKSMPLVLSAYMEFILEVDNAVRSALADVSASRRLEIEMALMTDGTVPQELTSVVAGSLAEIAVPKLLDSGTAADGGRLYFWDTRWLGVEKAGGEGERQRRYDAIRKVPLLLGTKEEGGRRECRRCGAEMEEIAQERMRSLLPWLHHAQRLCYCQNYWWVK